MKRLEMLQFREKSRYYQALSSVPFEDREDAHGQQHVHAKPEAWWSILFERLYRRKFQALFILLTILIFLSYLALNLKLTGYEYDDEFGFIKMENMEDNATDSQPISIVTSISQDGNNTMTPTSMACQLPKLNPFESSIQHLITVQVDIKCTDKFPYLFSTTLDSTLVTVQNPKEIYPNLQSCCYQALTRGTNASSPDNDYSLSAECYPVPLNASSETAIPLEHEFIVISCKFLNENATQANSSGDTQTTPGTGTADDNSAVFSSVVDMHFFIPEKPLVESRIEEYYEELLENPDLGNTTSTNEEEEESVGDPTNDTIPIPLQEQDRVNVVILGIDGVSNMNFIRVMPQSYAYLKDNLSAVAMQGFNKIADNTLPNLSASLASMNLSTLQASCVEDTAFDECPFIWKRYAEQGYRTSFAEDSTWMGIFNYEITGFKAPPTDYYLRPFGVAAESLIGTFRQYVARLCYGPRLSFQVLLDYVQKMAFSMGFDKRYFQFIWATSLTHDMLNYGKMGDKHLLETLKWFQEGEYFNQTVFILMSDHGIRWGEIHDYHQGHVEERLPFLYFIVPKWFQEKYERAYKNLMQNQDRLTTQFDLYETLSDLLDLNGLEEPAMIAKEQALEVLDEQKKLPRGISQFLPIPTSRTCEDAEIAEHYCTCHQSNPIDKNEPEVKEAANYVLNQINSMFLDFPECANLTIVDIKSSQVMELGYSPSKKIFLKGYELVINTMPGDALFETTVINNGTGSWRVSGTISRTNMMGNQSNCVKNGREVKLYCYCKDLIT